jgi:RNA polymerase-binding transcription factor DksA
VAKKAASEAGAAKSGKSSKKAPAKKKTVGRRRPGARSVAEAASEAQADAQGYVFINGRRVRMVSTGGKVPTRKKTVTSTVTEDEGPRDLEKPVKTTLTAKQLRHYRDVLMVKRAQIIGDLKSLEDSSSDSGELSKLPLHMADVGSDVYNQDLNIGLAENELARLKEIDHALVRIKAKTYGMCLLTGDPIPEARLEAKPTAKYTIESARRIERGWG